MTELVRSQSEIFLVMGGCGLAAGLIQDVFGRFVEIRRCGRIISAIMEIMQWIVTGFMVSEFFYFCDDGKISFSGIGSFLLGLWLWKRFFCDILTPIGGRDDKEKGTDKYIRNKRKKR